MKRESITLTEPKKSRGRIVFGVGIAILVLANVIVSALPARSESLSAGFVFDRFQLTLEDGLRTEAAGPFYDSQQNDTESVLAVPPFFLSYRDTAVESHEIDVLYPLFTRTQYAKEHRWQFCELLSTSSGLAEDNTTPHRFTLFPFYFQQRAADTNLNYTAVFPFYGRLKHRLFRDEMYFVMFPGYMETRKRDVVTDNYFFPFVDVRHGDGLNGWQVWPFIGREHKDITTETNGFGDVTTSGGHEHFFCCWPFYLSQSNGTGTKNPVTFQASIPFYAITRSPQYDSTSVLWPFFSSIDNRDRKYHEWEGPWPFVIFAQGAGKQTSRIWPFFSESRNDTKENDSYFWPGYIYTRTHSDPLDQQRTRVLFYLYSRLAMTNTETGKARIRVDMWPFFTWHHELDGNDRLQILAIVEPLVPDNPGIERNWSPLWSFWRTEHNGRTGAASQSLLWNLYRREAAAGHKRLSVFFGLYQSRENAQGKTVRLFYIPILRPHPADARAFP